MVQAARIARMKVLPDIATGFEPHRTPALFCYRSDRAQRDRALSTTQNFRETAE